MDTPTVQPPAPLVQQPVPAPPQSKNYSNIVIAILLVVIGILVGMELGEPPLVSNLRSKYLGAAPTPTSTLSPTPTPDITADWKTYTNTKNTYVLKYPTNWTLNDLTEGQQVEIYYQPDRTKSVGSILIEKLQRPPGDIAQYTTKKQIGNLTADCKSDLTGIKEWCYLSDYILSIFITKDQNLTYNETLDQILSTFKFLDQQTIPSITQQELTAGWYWGTNNQKKPNTPVDWVYTEAGRSSCWHKSTVTCTPQTGSVYTCPASGWVDCMPGTTAKPECSAAAMAWYKTNCPNFNGGAY